MPCYQPVVLAVSERMAETESSFEAGPVQEAGEIKPLAVTPNAAAPPRRALVLRSDACVPKFPFEVLKMWAGLSSIGHYSGLGWGGVLFSLADATSDTRRLDLAKPFRCPWKVPQGLAVLRHLPALYVTFFRTARVLIPARGGV